LGISTTLPAPLGNLGTATITIQDTNVFSGTAPDVSLSVGLSPQLQTQILNILQKLDGVGGNLSANAILNTQIPLVNKTINQLFANGAGTDPGSYLKLHDVVQTFFNSFSNGQLPTANGLANVVLNQALGLAGNQATGTLAEGPLSITGGLQADTQQLVFHLVFNMDRTVNLPLDFGAAAQDLGLAISGSAAADVAVHLNLDADFGIDLAHFLSNPTTLSAQDVFFQVNNASASAQLHATNVNLVANLGFLQAEITGGTVDLSAAANLAVQKPGSTPGTFDTRITAFDLDPANPNALSLASLISVNPTSSLNATLPLQASLDGTPVFTDPANAPSIVITDLDLFHQAPTVTANFGALGDFNNITPVQVFGLLNQLTGFLNQYRQSDVFNVPIPFVANTTLGTLFDLGSSFSHKVLTDLETAGASLYSQADVPSTFSLTSAATFTLLIDGTTSVDVTVPATPTGAGTRTIDDLVNAVSQAVSQALQGAGLDPNAVIVSHVGNRIRLLRAGTDPAQQTGPIDPTRTLQITAASGSALDQLHFAVGQKSSDPKAPSPLFTSAQDLANALLQELGLGAGFGPVVSYDHTTKILSFHIKWSDTFPTLTLPLNLNLNLGDIAHLTTAATTSLSSDIGLDFTFGINLGSNNSSFQLTSALTHIDPITKQVIGVTPNNGQLAGDAHFQVTVGSNAPVSVTVKQADTANNKSVNDLAVEVNAALQAAGLSMVQAVVNANVIRLSLVGAVPGTTLAVSAALTDPAVTQLELPGDGKLPADSTFQLSINGAAPVTVTVKASDMTNNTSVDNPNDPLDPTTLVGNINAALKAAGIAGQVSAIGSGNRIVFQPVSGAGVTSLKFDATAGDPSITVLGFQDGTLVKAQTGDLFLSTGPLFHGHVHLAVDSTPGTQFATAQLGFLSLGIGTGHASVDASLDVGFQDPANTAAIMISLNTLLSDLTAGQILSVVTPHLTSSATLTLGGLTVNGLNVSNLLGSGQITVSLPNLLLPTNEINLGADGQGRLLADDFFSVNVGSVGGHTIALKQSDTAGNQSPADLLAEVNAALKTAGLDSLIQAASDPNAAPGTILFNLQANAPVIAADSQGRLAADAKFTVTVGAAAPVTITVKQSTAATNLSVDDLVSEVNAALKAATLDSSVQAVNTNGQVTFTALPGVEVAPVVNVSNYVQLAFDQSLASLLKLRSLSFTQIITALQTAVNGLSDISNSGNPSFAFLQTKIPIINKSAAELIDYAGTLTNDLALLTQDPAQVLDALQAKIETALGIDHNLDPVRLSFDPTTNVFMIGLDFQTSYDGQLPLNLDINSLKGLVSDPTTLAALDQLTSLVGVDASAQLHVQANAKLALNLGLDLSDVLHPRAFLSSDTGLAVGVKIDGSDLHFKVSAGPLGLFIGNGTNNGTLSLGADPTAGTPQDPQIVREEQQAGFASFGIGLRNTDQSGRYYLDGSFSKLFSDIRVNVEGKANVTLPIYFPTQDNPLGGPGNNNLVINVNSLSALLNRTPGSVTITPPPFAQAFSGLNALAILNNPAVFLNGLDSLLGTVQSDITSQVLSQAFPIIGNNLQQGAQFIQDFRTQILGQLRAVVGNNTTTQLIQQGLFLALGPGGLNLLVDDNGNALTDASQIGVTEVGVPGAGTQDPNAASFTDSFIEFHVHLKKSLTYTVPLDLNAALPDLGLSLNVTNNAQVQLKLDWDMYLNFGVSTRDGFFFDTVTKNAEGQAIDTNGNVITNPATQKAHSPVTLTLSAQLVNTGGPGASLATGSLGFLNLSASAVGNLTPALLSGTFFINVTDPEGTASKDNSRLTLSEILAGPKLSSVFNAGFQVLATVDLHLQASFDSGTLFPSIATDFHLDWSFTASTDGTTNLKGDVPHIQFNNVTMSLGQFLSNFVAPILQQVKTYLDPIKPIVDALRARIPVLSDLAGQDISLVDIASQLANASGDKRAKAAVEGTRIFLQAFDIVYSLSDAIAAATGDPNDLTINFGNFDLSTIDLRSQSLKALPFDTRYLSGNNVDVASQLQNASPAKKNLTSFLNTSATYTLEFPLLSKQAPQVIFAILSGKPADLFQFDMKSLNLDFFYRQIFPVLGPLEGTLAGSVKATIHFVFGYDTTGINEFKLDHNPVDLFDGFYLRTDDGPQIVVDAGITAGAALGLGSPAYAAGVEGGVFAHITASLNDPNGDGKLRYQEIAQLVAPPGGPINPLNIFDISGSLTARLYAYLDIGIINYQYDLVPPITLLTFTNAHPNTAPVLGSIDDTGTLTLNTGPLAARRKFQDTSDDNEHFVIRHTQVKDAQGNLVDSPDPGALTVTYYEPDGTTVTQNFAGVTKVVADAGQGNNIIDCAGINVPCFLSAEGNGSNVLIGGNADDTLIGGSGNDILTGGSGNNTFTGGGGNDTLTSSSDTNTTVESGHSSYVLNSSTGTIGIDGGTETLVNTTSGGNTFHPTGWKANLTGGSMPTTFDVSNWNANAMLTAGKGPATVVSSNDANFNLSDGAIVRTQGINSTTFTLQGVTNAQLATGAGNDSVTINGWTGSAQVHAGSGNTTFNVTSSHASLPNLLLVGGAGNDVLNLTIHGTILGDNNTNSIQAGNIQTINFDNSDNHDNLTNTPWNLSGGILQSGSNVLLAYVGAQQTTLKFGTGTNPIYVGGIANATTIQGGSGSDAIHVGTAVHPVGTIAAPLSIQGSGANSTLTIDDSADAFAASGDLTSPAGDQYDHVTGLRMPSSSAINYQRSAIQSVTVNLGSGSDAFNVHGTAVPLTINAGAGPDSIDVTDAAAAVTVNSGGATMLKVDRSADTADHSAEVLSGSAITGLGMANLTYGGLQSLELDLGTGHNVLDVQSTMAGGPTAINLGGPADLATVESVGAATTINGTGAGDVVTLNIRTAAPVAGEFAHLHVSIPKLVVDNSAYAQPVTWGFSGGRLNINAGTTNDLFVDTTGAGSASLAAGTNPNNTLTVASQGGAPQSVKLAGNAVQLDTGANVLSPGTFLSGDQLAYIQTITGLKDPVGVLTTPDGRYVYVTSGNDNSIAVFRKNLGNGQLIFAQSVKTGTLFNGQAVAGLTGPGTMVLSPDGIYLYVTTVNSIVVFQRDAATGLLVSEVQTVADGSTLGGQTVQGLLGAGAIAFSPDGNYLYAGGSSTETVIAILGRDSASGRLVSYQADFLPAAHNAVTISALAVSSDGGTLTARVQDYNSIGVTDEVNVFTRNVRTGALTNGVAFLENANSTSPFLGLTFNPSARAMAVSPDGRFAIILSGTDPVFGGPALTIYRRDPATGLFSEQIDSFGPNAFLAPLGIHNANQVVISPDGRSVYVVGGDDGQPGSPREVAYLGRDPQFGYLTAEGTITGIVDVSSIAVSPDSQYVYVKKDHGSFVDVFARSPGQLTFLQTFATGFAESPGSPVAPVTGIAISPDGSQLYVTDEIDGSLGVFNRNADGTLTTAGEQLYRGAFPGANSVAIASNGAYVFVGGSSGVTVLIRHSTFQAPLQTLTGLGVTQSLAVSPDGNLLYATISPVGVTYVYKINFTGLYAFQQQLVPGGSVAADGQQLDATLANPVVSPDGYVYIAGETGSTGGVAVLSQDASDHVALAQVMRANEGGAQIRKGNALIGSSDLAVSQGAGKPFIYVPDPVDNTLTVLGADATGVYHVVQSLHQGQVIAGHLLTELAGARSVAVSPDDTTLYVASSGNNQTPAGIAVFRLDAAADGGSSTAGLATGFLQFVANPSLTGFVNLAVSADGKSLVASGTGNNILWKLTRDPSTGLLTPLQQLTSAPSTVDLAGLASVVTSPDGQNVYAVAPQNDAVAVFGRTAQGSLVLQAVLHDGDTSSSGLSTAGLSAPVALAVSADGKNVYVISAQENAIAVFGRNAAGQLSFLQSLTSSDLATASALAVSPDGASVYITETAGVHLFSRDQATGVLASASSAAAPGDTATLAALASLGTTSAIAVSPDGGSVYITSASGNAVNVFRRSTDPASPYRGTLVYQQTLREGDIQDGQAVIGLAGASSASVSPDGKYVFVTSPSDNAVAVFGRDPASGLLTFIQDLRNGVAGVQGLAGASAVAVTQVLLLDNGTGQKVAEQFVLVAGAADNSLAVFTWDTTPGTPNFGKLVFLQRLVNNAGNVTGLNAPNSIALDNLGNVFVGTPSSTTNGGLSSFSIATSVPPPTHYALSYSGLGSVGLQLGDGNAAVQDLGTPDGVAVGITTGNGASSFDLAALGTNAGTTITTGNGPNTFDLVSTTSNAQLTITTGTGGSTFHVSAIGGGSASDTINDGSAGDTIVVAGRGLTPGASRLVVNGHGLNPLVFNGGNRVTDPAIPNAHTGTLAATDGAGNDFGAVRYNNVTLTVNQAPPVAVVLPPPAVAEGGSLTLDGSQSAAVPGHAIVSYAFEVNNSGQFINAPGGRLTLGWSDLVQLGVADEGTFSVRLRVTDDQGPANLAEAETTFQVIEGAPTLTLSGAPVVRLNDTYTLTLQASDPSADGPRTWTINWGDGTAQAPDLQMVTGNLTTAMHAYTRSGSFTITASASDSDGGPFQAQNAVTVQVKSFPHAEAGGPYLVLEGGSLTLNGAASFDPDGSALSYAWDISGSGQFADATGVAPTLSWAQLQSILGSRALGGSTVVIGVRTSDQNGSDTAYTTLTSGDVAPTLTLAGAPTVAEGTAYTLNLSALGSGLGVDPIQSWSINWGDGTTQNPDMQMVSGNPASLTHVYARGPNAYTISASAADADGTYQAANTVTIAVKAVPPTLTLSGPASVTEGALYTLNLAASGDLSVHPLTSWTINWGDNTSETYSTASSLPANWTANGQGGYTVTHSFSQGGQPAFISAQASDDTGTYDANFSVPGMAGQQLPSVKVQVVNVAPTESAAANQSATATVATTFNLGSFTDPGTQDGPWTVQVSWGDPNNTPTTFTTASEGSLGTAGHTYASPGTYTVTVSVIDQGGLTGRNTFKVTVGQVPSTTSVTSSSPSSVYGQSVTFTAVVNGNAQGSVSFYDNNAFLGTGTLSMVNGVNQASFSTTFLRAGGHSITATYGGDAVYLGSSTVTSLSQTVRLAPLTVTGANQSRVHGQANPVFTGTITGLVNGDQITATYTTSAGPTSPVGTYAIVAAAIDSTTSRLGNYAVTLVNGTLTIGQDSTTTTGSVSSPSTSFGQALTFTATVAAKAPGSGTPTGNVDFFDLTTNTDLGVVALSAGSAALTTASLDTGSHTLLLSYGSDANFLPSSATISATVSPSVEVLDPTASGALRLSGNAHLTTPGSIVVDSSSASAVLASGNATVSAASIQIVGGYQATGNAHLNPTPATHVAVSADPLAGLAAPTGGVVQKAIDLGGNQALTINPGIYAHIQVSGNARLTLNPGVYILAGGGFTVAGNARVTGSGVLLYNAGSNFPGSGGKFGALILSGNAHVNLSAAATGPYAGLVLFQARDNQMALLFSGNAIQSLSGLLYAPAAVLAVQGNAQLNGPLVVKQLQLTDNAIDSAGGALAGGTSSAAGNLTADELARIQDARALLDALLAPLGTSVAALTALYQQAVTDDAVRLADALWEAEVIVPPSSAAWQLGQVGGGSGSETSALDRDPDAIDDLFALLAGQSETTTDQALRLVAASNVS
jgi:6-phosphogluconolactonase (cycloisomerase 2 family)